MLKFLKNALLRAGSPFVFNSGGLPRDLSDKTARDIGLSPADLERLRQTWPSQR